MIRKMIFGIIGVVLCSTATMADMGKDFDLVILNGRVMDPETGHDALKNVGIRDGKIISITTKILKGKQTIDAKGLVVAPGFIDLHNHSQNADGYLRSVQDGVTTAIELELGAFPVAGWYEARESKALINFGASVSHGLVRSVVMGGADISAFSGKTEEDLMKLVNLPGWVNERATPEQLLDMKNIIARELDDGGLGIGYHLVITPGADVEEMLDFYELSTKKQVVNFIHIRSLGQVSPMESGREIVHAAKTKDASIHVVHINSSGLWETTELLELFNNAQKQGLDVSTEVYPYDAAPTNFRDPRVTQKGGLEIFRIGYNDLELMHNGERLTEESFQYYLKNNPDAGIIAHIMKEKDIATAIAHPMVMIASDGVDLENGKGHPRGAGTYSRVLGHYVREKKLLTLMDALRKISLMPAQRMETFVPQMKQRGRIQEGMIADITIFDADVVKDKSNYVDPTLPAAGIAHVIVNGKSVVSNYTLLQDVYPGQAIRRSGEK